MKPVGTVPPGGGSDEGYPHRAPCDEAPHPSRPFYDAARPPHSRGALRSLDAKRLPVKRRAFLAGGSAAVTVGTAGCLVGYREEGSERTEYPGIAGYGYPSTICEEGLRPDAVRAVDDPAFGPDWDGIDLPDGYRRDGGLTDDRVVVGVERAGTARAYPLSVLARHEVVNDVFGPRSEARTRSDGECDVPLLVTYCPICRSGLVARREVDGEPATFGVTGLLWKLPDAYAAASEADGTAFGASESDPDAAVRDSANLVMYDEPTRSYWSQLLAEAICGPEAGDGLEVLPSTVATWGVWRAEHPDTVVLLPPPLSGTLRPPRTPSPRPEG